MLAMLSVLILGVEDAALKTRACFTSHLPRLHTVPTVS